MDYKEKYQDALDLARTFYEGYIIQGHNDEAGILAEIFSELKESEDEKIRKAILELVKQSSEILGKQNQNNMIAWLEKQSESNPYSGVSFKYNDHIWGMCARDNGVDILLDKQLFKHLEKQGEQKNDPCTDCTNDKGCVTCEHGELRETHTRTLNADEVIAWLVANICDYEYYIKRFKQDFGL